jgi:hypothetical protein
VHFVAYEPPSTEANRCVICATENSAAIENYGQLCGLGSVVIAQALDQPEIFPLGPEVFDLLAGEIPAHKL